MVPQSPLNMKFLQITANMQKQKKTYREAVIDLTSALPSHYFDCRLLYFSNDMDVPACFRDLSTHLEVINAWRFLKTLSFNSRITISSLVTFIGYNCLTHSDIIANLFIRLKMTHLFPLLSVGCWSSGHTLAMFFFCHTLAMLISILYIIP